MTKAPPRASVIVVSRGRPEHLRRCLMGLQQQDHPEFELVVVADASGLAVVQSLGLTHHVKARLCDAPNISSARNLGIGAAAAEICAFIDDDAVPEPTWLSRLCAPFIDPLVSAAGGFVRGRNGISFQWKAQAVDAVGQCVPLQIGNELALFHGLPGRAIKTEGTNCAFRRKVLARLGGFDPAFSFYLDETDLNMRLAAAEHVTAIVPGSEVHHSFGPSRHRMASRAPRSLHEIGASMAVFLRKHAPRQERQSALAALQDEQHRRLLRHMVRGTIEPRDVGRLMETLAAGITEGEVRLIEPLPPLPVAPEPFRRFPGTGVRAGALIAGWCWNTRRLNLAARAERAEGKIVTLLRLSPTSLFHHLRFGDDGIWIQSGGLFGRSRRDGPLFQPMSFSRRVAAERRRLIRTRQLE